jgi:hypothetical protein
MLKVHIISNPVPLQDSIPNQIYRPITQADRALLLNALASIGDIIDQSPQASAHNGGWADSSLRPDVWTDAPRPLTQ